MAQNFAPLVGADLAPARMTLPLTASTPVGRFSLAPLRTSALLSHSQRQLNKFADSSSSRAIFVSRGKATPQVDTSITRRQAILPALVATILASPLIPRASAGESPSAAGESLPPPKKVFVAGATGQTGRRIVKALVSRGIRVQAGVRSVEKAKELFADVDASLIDYVVFDVLGAASTLSASIDPSVDAIIVATGFSPQPGQLPNLLLPWQVDCEGTKHIVDAARQVGVSRLVMVSSLLTNGAAWGQLLNPNYILLNVFGLILVAKLQAEQYIQKSGINYTIVRPGGLKNDPPRGTILARKEDTLGAGSISRDSVAEVAVESLLWKSASYKIVEIVEEADAPKKTYEELFATLS